MEQKIKLSFEYDFEVGAHQVSDQWIDKCREEIVDRMIENKEVQTLCQRTGNGMMFGERDTENNEIIIYEIRHGYKQKKYDNALLRKIENGSK